MSFFAIDRARAWARTLFAHLLGVLPTNALSLLVGKLSAFPLPRRMRIALFAFFARRYGANLEEAELPIDSYRSLRAFFTRNLKARCRPLGSGVVSPVDAEIVGRGTISLGSLLQVKGIFCSVEELLGERELAERYEGGSYLTLYLAPGDYHHFHAPISACIERAIHIEGALFPVNSFAVRTVDRLYARNERVVIPLFAGDTTVTLVAVGAMNVGSISLSFLPLCTNSRLRFSRTLRTYPTKTQVVKGERLGAFSLGSTVILLFEPARFAPADCPSHLRLGMTVGELLSR
jgi:phosphatidylserine decarboxylase